MSELSPIDRFRAPGGFTLFMESIGYKLFGGQRDFAKAIETLTLESDLAPKRLGVKAGTGTGKTVLMCGGLLWRTLLFPHEAHYVTASTETQVRDVSFLTMAKLIRESWLAPMFVVKGMKVHVVGHPGWMIRGVTASDENALRGRHSPNMTIAVEEITGVPDDNVNALIRTLTEKGNMFLSIFNPDKISGIAYEMFNTMAHEWPWNLTINKLELARDPECEFVDMGKVDEIRRMYGENSAAWQIGVLGEFPTEGQKNVITLSDWNKTQYADPQIVVRQTAPFRSMGVDYAYEGMDESVIAVRENDAIIHLEVGVNQHPEDWAARAREISHDLGWGTDCVMVPDPIGIGATTIRSFVDAGFPVEDFRPNRKSPVDGYKDHQSAAYFNIKQKIRNGLLYLPDDNQLKTQLITREYQPLPMPRGMFVEPKAEYKKRMGKSPDRADAVVMAFSPVTDVMATLTQAVDTPQKRRPQFDLFPDSQPIER
ncbi:MAG: hypothetical protein AAFP86_13380, partial [Planctomycetota bacterium]